MSMSMLHICALLTSMAVISQAATVPPVTTRLVNGTQYAGRVEVWYNGVWGTVCDDLFEDIDATVVCYSLGFGYVGRAYCCANYGEGTGQIWLDSVQCTGTETSIGDCSHNTWGSHDCQHTEDVSVDCTQQEPPAVTTRLVNGDQYAGRVEVWYNGTWGTVCDDAFGDLDATVVCYSLGYGYVGHSLFGAYYGAGTGQIWLDEVACTGTETFVGDCNHLPWGSHNCGHSEDVSVNCTVDVTATTPPPPAVTTRLVNGNQYAGRVEVWYNGVWGTVCDDFFEDVDATVVCYSLGYGYVGRVVSNIYGDGIGQIWLDDVQCTGTETFIGDCSHLAWGSHNCGHYEDVSVDCTASTTPPMTTTTTTTPTPTPEPTTTTTTTTTTTQASTPPIPPPFTELSHEAEMIALDMSMTPSCLNQYSDQFKQTLTGELEKAKQAILSTPDFCPGAHDVTLQQTAVNMMAMNSNVYLNFDVDVLTQGTETLDSITYCSQQLGNYLADFNNWKQPIWIDIYNCPRLQFTSGQFNLTSVAWKCP